MKNTKWKIRWKISGTWREVAYTAAEELRMRMMMESCRTCRLDYELFEDGQLIRVEHFDEQIKKGRKKK